MNRDHVLFHLREAHEELGRTLDQIAADRGYAEGYLEVALAHAYHHLNTAWNARHESKAALSRSSDEAFNRWGRFPTDLPLPQLGA